jgi:hypothetical protein
MLDSRRTLLFAKVEYCSELQILHGPFLQQLPDLVFEGGLDTCSNT